MSRPLRTNGQKCDSRLFLYDQPVVINALYTQILPKNWVWVVAFVLGQGTYTPVTNRVYDMSTREFIPVYGERDSEIDPFFSLDLRGQRIHLSKLEAGDLFGRTKCDELQECRSQSWSYDYSEETPIQGQPTFPILGLKGEW